MAELNGVRPVNQRNVTISESFFKNLMRLASENIIPYQWEALNDNVPGAEPSYCIRNFRAAAGKSKNPHGGFVFQDSDLFKWIEAAAYMLMWKEDLETERHIDETVQLMEEAQQPDGYLDTYYILTGLDKRWTNLRDNHELYCAGHLIEAAVAYFRATGKRRLLDVAIRYVDCIDARFGPEDGKVKGYPGHEEIELALVKLYEVTGDEKHLKLAHYFIEQRGQKPLYFDIEAEKRGDGQGWSRGPYSGNRYYQAGAPVREQKKALGHAVRQGYLLSGMADVARETGDKSLTEACKTMWKDITRRQMYITGAIGQSAYGEAFTMDDDLPNDLIYGETCAAISLYFFDQRMMRLDPRGEYGDAMDRLLYNGTISGMNLRGDRFFYVNPMESWPARNAGNQQFAHIRSERQKWFGCACCPPNLARMISSLPGSVLYQKADTVYVTLFTSCEAKLALDGGEAAFAVETGYPWDGRVTVRMRKAFPGMTLALRLPAWCKTYRLNVNGEYARSIMDDGYLFLTRDWQAGDEVEFDMDMPVTVIRAHPRIRADIGKIAVQRGPVVYCLEEIDNGANLPALSVRADAKFELHRDEAVLGGIPTLACDAKRLTETGWDEYETYCDRHAPVKEDVRAVFVPYYAWNNRGTGEMLVWVREEA